MAFVKTWGEGDLGSTYQDDIDDIVEDTRYGVRERANIEHLTYADETGKTDVWRHRKEASRTNYGTAANKPTTEATGRVDGARYRETDTGLVKYWNATTEAWVTEGASGHGGVSTTYTTGTVTVTNASAVVTGVDTAWVVGGITTADVFKGPDSEYYAIASIDSATQITLGRAYDGTTAAGASYTIYLNGHPHYVPKSGGTINGTLTVDGATTHGAAVAMGANKITGLAAATANGDAVRYEQLMTYRPTIFTYTGNGTDNRNVTNSGLGTSTPILAVVMAAYSSSSMPIVVKTADMGLYTKGGGGGYNLNQIHSLIEAGFQVGTDNAVNSNTVTYVAICWI